MRNGAKKLSKYETVAPLPKILIVLMGLLAPFFEDQLQASWGLGVGYHNPVSSDLGVSFLYRGKTLGFEAALGGANLWSDDNDSGASLSGDVDVKLFLGTSLEVYLEAGMGFGFGASSEGAGLSVGQGGLFAGGGLLLEGRSIYGLLGGDYLFDASEARFMATLGFWL